MSQAFLRIGEICNKILIMERGLNVEHLVEEHWTVACKGEQSNMSCIESDVTGRQLTNFSISARQLICHGIT
jgi:hypothetical protein